MSRSRLKGPYIEYKLLKKIRDLNETNTIKIIKTWSRSSTIIPSMLNHTIAVHNGKQHIPIFITEDMIGHKLGEFISTRNFNTHRKTDRTIKKK
uniref:Small ribosomal subunit protein uS19c n=1 Tax=Pterocladiophila hemisphaerica TaxID=2712948 RepID=A0A6M3WWJ8_9FLOR|nr:ribosomal protein S19 [Pterocladiophila hemisphaerica]